MKDREEAAESLIAFGMREAIKASLGRWLPCMPVTSPHTFLPFLCNTHTRVHPCTHALTCHDNTKPVLLTRTEGGRG